MAVAGVIINAGRFWFYRDSLERRTLGAGARLRRCPSWCSAPGSTACSTRASVGTVLGIVVIASVPLRRLLRTHARSCSAPPGLAVGSGVFGLASGVATGTGVILVSLLLGTGMAGPAVLATDALVSIALDLCKAALFQRFASSTRRPSSPAWSSASPRIPGSAIAAWLVNRMHAHLHVLFMEA